MYFYKPIDHNIISDVYHDRQAIDLNEYYRAFGFIDSVQNEKLDIIKNIYKENPKSRLLPDIASSVIKHLFSDGFINRNKFKGILECLQSIISDMGYVELTDDSLSNLLNVPQSTTHNVMMVAGCQNPSMLDARVEKAVEIAVHFQNNINVVASGANPNKDKPAKIGNESARMINLFTTGINKYIEDKSKRPKMDVLPENQSKNTNDNVAKFFDGHFLKRQSTNKINQIIVVSSTSHLIRLSREIEDYINNHKESLDYKISNIILVGSEGLDKVFHIDNHHLFKHMMLEIYDYLILKKYNIGS
jgi:hypothetical protein